MNRRPLIASLLAWLIVAGSQVLPSDAAWPAFPPAVAAPSLTKTPGIYGSAPAAEAAPFVYHGEPLLLESYRSAKPWEQIRPGELYLAIKNLRTGDRVASPFGIGYSLACVYVNKDEVNVFATQLADGHGTDIYRFTSTDLTHWTKPAVVIQGSSGENLWNSSVARDGDEYVMAYESNNPVQFCFKFAKSTDLSNWRKIDVPPFAGPHGNEYSVCPMIRAYDDWYYVTYLHAPIEGHNGYITHLARSKDFVAWEYSDGNPILEAGEGINNSDVDMFEYNGKTYLFYSTGDQATWGNTKLAVFDGSPQRLLESYFPAAPEPGARVLLGTALIAAVLYYRRKWSQME